MPTIDPSPEQIARMAFGTPSMSPIGAIWCGECGAFVRDSSHTLKHAPGAVELHPEMNLREPTGESRYEPDKAMVERAAEALLRSVNGTKPHVEIDWPAAARAALVAAGGVPESALEKAARDVVDGYENRYGIVLRSGIEALKAALSGAGVLHPETDSTEP